MAEDPARPRFAQTGFSHPGWAKSISGAVSARPFGAGLERLARSQPGKYLDRFRERPARDCSPGDNPLRHHWITTGLPNYWRQRDDGLSPLYSVLPAGAATDRSKARLLSGLPQESKTTALCNAGLSSSAPALATEVVGNRHREPRVR